MAKNCKEVNMINFEDIQRVRQTLNIGDYVMLVGSGKTTGRGEKYPVVGKNRHFFSVRRRGGIECFGYTELLADEGDVRLVS